MFKVLLHLVKLTDQVGLLAKAPMVHTEVCFSKQATQGLQELPLVRMELATVVYIIN